MSVFIIFRFIKAFLCLKTHSKLVQACGLFSLWQSLLSLLYSYDAAGGKVQELSEGAAPVDYVGNFIYKDGRLQYILTSEGRTVYDGDNDVFKEEFFVKDHLGNVRSVIDVTESPIRNYLATYEIASANLEGLLFDHHDEVRDDRPGSYDPEDGHSARLNGAEADRRIGTSLLVQVMAGDRVAMNVNNYYDGYDPLRDNTVSAGSMLDALVGTLANGGGGIPGEAHNPEVVGQLFTSTNYSAINDMLANATDPTMPKAYLNYVLFDHDMNIVSSMTGAFQANGSGDWAEIGTTAAMEMPVNGYLAVYLSNSSTNLQCATCSDIYFDHLNIRVSKGRLLEEEHYYPHGLPMAGMGAAADGFKENRHKHQGNEYIKELGLNWMDFHARQYDPQIGRFLGVDPLADYGGQDRFSPYAAMGNMPESMVDPDGMFTRVPGMMDDERDPNAGNWSKIPMYYDMDIFHGGGGATGAYGASGSTTVWGSGRTLGESSKMDYQTRSAWWATTLGNLYKNSIVPTGTTRENYQGSPQDADKTGYVAKSSIVIDGSKGGIINNYADFYDYMVDQANLNPVEVAAWVLLDPLNGNESYFILPWTLNKEGRSYHNYEWLPEGFEKKDILGEYHTHPHSTGPSGPDGERYDGDAVFRQQSKTFVRPIGADGHIWETDYYEGPIPIHYIITVQPSYNGLENARPMQQPFGKVIYYPNKN